MKPSPYTKDQYETPYFKYKLGQRLSVGMSTFVLTDDAEMLSKYTRVGAWLSLLVSNHKGAALFAPDGEASKGIIHYCLAPGGISIIPHYWAPEIDLKEYHVSTATPRSVKPVPAKLSGERV
eukprot:Filipodium_phascolosomae@DN1950_c0_g1_i3.p1